MTFRNGLDSLLRPEDSVLVLIDHQAFQLTNVNSHDPQAVVNNVTALAHADIGDLMEDAVALVARVLGIDYAKVLECRTLHIMSGMIAPGADVKAMHRTFISNLKMACDRTAKSGLTLVLEPINHRDIPGYFTNTTGQVEQIMKEVGAPHLKLQLDLYHCQVTEGDLTKRTERLFPITAHVQIAGNPDRNEPDIGEANHLYLLDVLDRLGYQGYVGLEYKPKTTTGAGLGWAAKYGIKA